MENEEIKTEERKTEPAGISKEDMQAAIAQAVAEAVKATRESMLEEIQKKTLSTETEEGEKTDYETIVGDIQ